MDLLNTRFSTKMHHELRFPSKRWLPLDEKDIEERRIKISKYFNMRRHLTSSEESYPQISTNISFNVHLGDGQMVVIKCSLLLCTDDVMKKISEQLQITNHERFLQMFGLFLARPRNDSVDHVDNQFNMIVVRLLRNFESPYATLQTANQRSATNGIYHKLVIRKMIWDPRVEESLLNDAVFVDLLYRQAKSDLRNGFFSIQSESLAKHLCVLEAEGDKQQVGSDRQKQEK
ncbi:hypothetical protein DICVIV_09978 [Dictyocaulus viviparus]|uniref:FERM domain-containing protein n=1 Tax=Dictyocaulus viviparus TaxID=29172 RepID=A0A0D8XH53_DICVI|nr:hypothetical protein DICVIV_09978 [Dictyocaulus viviparus]